MRHQIRLTERQLLREYNRDITAQKWGDKLIDAFDHDSLHMFQTAIPAHAGQERNLLNMHKYEFNRGNSVTKNPAFRLDVVKDILAELEARDPSPNKMYMMWLIRMYINKSVKLADVNRQNWLTRYHVGKIKRLIKPEHADINRFKTYRDFETVMHEHYTHITTDSKSKGEEDRGNAEVFYEDAVIKVVIPKDEVASCRYGAGTHWCTAATEGQNHFDRYNSDGTLYIFLPKDNSAKYQLFLSYGSAEEIEFRDEDDDWVNPVIIRTKWPGVYEKLMSVKDDTAGGRYHHLDALVVMQEPGVIIDIMRKMKDMLSDAARDVLWQWESDDERYAEQNPGFETQTQEDEDGNEIEVEVEVDQTPYTEWHPIAGEVYDAATEAINMTYAGLMDKVNAGLDYEEEGMTPMTKIPDVYAETFKEHIGNLSYRYYRSNTHEHVSDMENIFSNVSVRRDGTGEKWIVVRRG